jgi:RNA polymerase sigma-70 factor (ECF subfamily)
VTYADPANVLSDLSKDALAEERIRLTRYCARFVGDYDIADDLAQETLLEALRHVTGLRDRSVWRSWLIGIARNVCLRYVKERTRERERRAEGDIAHMLAEQVPDDSENPLQVLERDEREKLLDRAMNFLAAGARDLLVQRYVEDLPTTEISARQGLTENLVNVRLHRSRAALRQILFSEPFREEVAAFGLRGGEEESDGWQQTNIWCPRCGENKLLGRYTPDSENPVFVVRCISCQENLGVDFTSNHVFFDTKRVLRGVKGFKPALNRLHHWWYEQEQHAVSHRKQYCFFCGRATDVVFSPPPGTPERFRGVMQYYAVCPSCKRFAGPTALGMAAVHPEVQRFWRRYPRMRGLDHVTVLLNNGAKGTLARFESVTDSARIELLFSDEDARLLELRSSDASMTEKEEVSE